MTVQVNEAGRDQLPVRVDHTFGGRVRQHSNLGDNAVENCDVSAKSLAAGPVNDFAVANQRVEFGAGGIG